MIKNKKILAITLARGGSKRVKRKNIIEICGKPLIQYTIEEVRKSSFIDRYVVSSDDIEVLSLCKGLGVDHIKRSSQNSLDTSTSADAIKETLSHIKEEYDYVVEVMCTNPLKNVIDIDNAIEKLHSTNADSVVSVVRIWDHHPSRVKFIENDRLVDVYPEIPESRRQDLSPPAYVRNGSIYAFTMKSFKKFGTRLGDDCRAYIMPEERSINIDEEIDLELARILIEKRKMS